eukprot:4257133-Amphidinium_carterae.1
MFSKSEKQQQQQQRHRHQQQPTTTPPPPTTTTMNVEVLFGKNGMCGDTAMSLTFQLHSLCLLGLCAGRDYP